jgi:hypothetical protein
MRVILISKGYFLGKKIARQPGKGGRAVDVEDARSDDIELAAPVGGFGDWKAGFEFGLVVDGENQGLRCVTATFALIGVGLVAPVFAGGADGGGGACGLSSHGNIRLELQKQWSTDICSAQVTIQMHVICC